MKNKVKFPNGSIVIGEILKIEKESFLFKYKLGESEYSAWLPNDFKL